MPLHLRAGPSAGGVDRLLPRVVRRRNVAAMRASKLGRRARGFLLARRQRIDGRARGQDGASDAFGSVFHEISLVIATLLAVAVAAHILVGTSAP
jgi:hypothetical protein